MITDKQYKAFARYLYWMKFQLGLGEWRVDIHHEPPSNDEAIAEIRPTYGQRHSVLMLDPTIIELSHDEIRRVIAHEVLHLAHRDASEVFRTGLPPLIGQPTYNALWEAHTQHAEIMVDQLARAFSDMVKEAGKDLKFLTAIRKSPDGRREVEFRQGDG